jgi:DNA polymerase-3 subunit epsilon
MVASAPIFDDISEKVLEMLTDRIFVAHNVNFDHSFIKNELELSEFKWATRKLCTVRAARKIKPGLSSYSLGNLCRALDIPLLQAHRAGADADATAIFLSRLLIWDADGEIAKMTKRNSHDQNLPPNLPPSDFETLPEKPGVYYFYNRLGKVIDIGKAKNIKKRIAQNFGGHKITPQRQHFMRDIYSISYEICATEFIALLLECCEIKKLWPIYNKALKRFEPKFGLYHYEARNGYQYLAIGKLAKGQASIELFYSQYDGVSLLLSLAKDSGIDHRFCHYATSDKSEFIIEKDISSLPKISQHNEAIDKAMDFLISGKPSFAIIDKGRSQDERSCIWVENGHFYGMGYISSDIGFTQAHEIKEYVTPYSSNQYIMQLIYAYANKYPGKVIMLSGPENLLNIQITIIQLLIICSYPKLCITPTIIIIIFNQILCL